MALALALSAAAQGAAAAGIASKTPTMRPAAVRAYWTPARMRQARPGDLAIDAAGNLVRAAAQPRTATDVSATSDGFPGRVHGKVFFSIEGGAQPGDYVCSGTAVRSNSHTLAWTAGHCVEDPEFGGGFATNWTFVPAYRNGGEPYGEWPATQLLTTDAWRDDADIRQDFGAAVLARNASGQGIEDAIGARPIEFGLPRAQQYAAFGYPAQPTVFEPTFDGERLYSCDSAVTGSDSPPGSGPDTVEIDCDMSGGSSGGGWVNADGALNGLTSYGYDLDFGHLYGPYFGADAKRLYLDASGRTARCAGAAVTNLGRSVPDDLSGGAGNDVFKLGAGADRARSLAGDDVICGGGGNDVMRGGPGDDLCVGGPGRDRGPGCEHKRQIP
jgi:hypothetical protein